MGIRRRFPLTWRNHGLYNYFMLKTNDLQKFYGGKCVLDNLNLEFRTNKIYGILGRNGAGKTTLINIITNRAFATSGGCVIDGADACENDWAQNKVFCITEKSEYPYWMKVKESFKWAKLFYPSFDSDYAVQLSRKFDLDINKRFKHLSTGYKTIAKVILTLASGAPVMILDEPVLGIDAIYRKAFYDELLKLHKQRQNLVIIASHILDEIQEVASDIIILKNGGVAYNGPVKAIESSSLQDFYIKLHQFNDTVPDDKKPKGTKQKTGASKIDKQKFKTAAFFQIRTLYWSVIMITGVLLLNYLIGIILSAAGGEPGGSIDIVTIVFMAIVGVQAHGYFFGYSIYNGTSRKTYFLATCTVLFGTGIILSVFTVFFLQLSVWNGESSITLFKLLYPHGGFAAMAVWVTAALVFLAALGWFVKVVYDILSKLWRIITIGCLTAVFMLCTLWHILSPETSFFKGLGIIMGLEATPSNAWAASVSFLILSGIFTAGTWFLMKRQEVK